MEGVLYLNHFVLHFTGQPCCTLSLLKASGNGWSPFKAEQCAAKWQGFWGNVVPWEICMMELSEMNTAFLNCLIFLVLPVGAELGGRLK